MICKRFGKGTGMSCLVRWLYWLCGAASSEVPGNETLSQAALKGGLCYFKHCVHHGDALCILCINDYYVYADCRTNLITNTFDVPKTDHVQLSNTRAQLL